MDYGAAEFMESKRLNSTVIVFASERVAEHCFQFIKKSGAQYACVTCKRLGKSRLITVHNERIVGKKHPEDDHHPECQPLPRAEIEAQKIDRSMRASVRATGKRPREAYNDAVASISKRFKRSADIQQVVVEFPAYNDVSRQLRRHREATHIPVPNPRDIPDELRVTLRGNSVVPGDDNYKERFLLYSGQEGKLLIFCANTELLTLHESEYVVCDGTFEMAPNSSFQLYTLHGFLNGESMPLLWALLPD